jgi:hypothetical protein
MFTDRLDVDDVTGLAAYAAGPFLVIRAGGFSAGGGAGGVAGGGAAAELAVLGAPGGASSGFGLCARPATQYSEAVGVETAADSIVAQLRVDDGHVPGSRAGGDGDGAAERPPPLSGDAVRAVFRAASSLRLASRFTRREEWRVPRWSPHGLFPSEPGAALLAATSGASNADDDLGGLQVFAPARCLIAPSATPTSIPNSALHEAALDRGGRAGGMSDIAVLPAVAPTAAEWTPLLSPAARAELREIIGPSRSIAWFAASRAEEAVQRRAGAAAAARLGAGAARAGSGEGDGGVDALFLAAAGRDGIAILRFALSTIADVSKEEAGGGKAIHYYPTRALRVEVVARAAASHIAGARGSNRTQPSMGRLAIMAVEWLVGLPAPVEGGGGAPPRAPSPPLPLPLPHPFPLLAVAFADGSVVAARCEPASSSDSARSDMEEEGGDAADEAGAAPWRGGAEGARFRLEPHGRILPPRGLAAPSLLRWLPPAREESGDSFAMDRDGVDGAAVDGDDGEEAADVGSARARADAATLRGGALVVASSASLTIWVPRAGHAGGDAGRAGMDVPPAPAPPAATANPPLRWQLTHDATAAPFPGDAVFLANAHELPIAGLGIVRRIPFMLPDAASLAVRDAARGGLRV